MNRFEIPLTTFELWSVSHVKCRLCYMTIDFLSVMMLHFNPLILYDDIWLFLILTFSPEQEMLAIPLVLVVLVTVWMQLVSVLHQSLTLVTVNIFM